MAKAPSGLSKSLSKSKKSSSKKSGSKKKHRIRHMSIEPADNGGFNVRHQYHNDNDADDMGMQQPGPPDTTHAMGGPDDLLGHVQGQFGGQLPPAAAGPSPSGGGM